MIVPDYKKMYKEEPLSYSGRIKVLASIFEEVVGILDIQGLSLEYSSRLTKTLGYHKGSVLKRINEIVLSQKYVQYGAWMSVVDTLLHELAHAWDFKNRGVTDHGYRWQACAIKLGAVPERTSKYLTAGQKYLDHMRSISKVVADCPECGREAYFHRVPKRTYGCRECNQGRRVFLPYKITINDKKHSA